MEQLKNIKQTLMNCVQGQLGDLKNTDTKELGEAIDMIKDLEEAMYYCSIVKAMEESKKEQSQAMKYSYPPVMYNGGSMYMNDNERMYYDGGINNRRMYYDGMDRRGEGRMYYEGGYPVYLTDQSRSYPNEIRDYREGRSPITRRNYMESKELHHDKSKQMQELEKYMNELTQDIMDMINDASPEEKQVLAQKLNILSGKIK